MIAVSVLVLAATGVAAYWFVGRPGPAADVAAVAVMPFVNESTTPDNEYLSDGISAALINSLSRLSGLRVIARTSTFQYKNKVINLQEIGRALGVGAVVTGHLAQRGDRLRIGVELVDAAAGTVIWGEQYDRGAGELQQLQAEISRELALRLRPALTKAERDRLGKVETASQQAYDLVLRGRFYFDKGGTQNRWTAIEHYQKALAIDPSYPLAHVGLSRAYGYMIFLSVVDPKEYGPKVEAAARTALALDPDLAEAHTAMAFARRSNWDWRGAEESFKHALALNANLPDAHDGYASFLTVSGRHDEAVAESRLARQLDPLSVVLNTHVGSALLFARRYAEAIQVLNQSRDMDPASSVTHLFLGYTHAAAGRFADAIAAYDEAIRLGDDSASAQIYLGAAYAGLGQRERAESILRQLETRASYVSPGELALLYGALGRRDRAFASLAAAFEARDVQLMFIGVDPAFDSLREDPRFAPMLQAVGLSAEPRR
jgi:TolB-like protein/Tfp pilus assembly protein PilF